MLQFMESQRIRHNLATEQQCVCVCVHLTFNLFSPRVLKDFDGENFTCVF